MLSPRELLTALINIYILIIFAQVILSWLLAFNVVNVRNWFVMVVAQILYQLTEPVYRPIRDLLPKLGAIDISPVIVFLLLIFLRRMLWDVIFPI
jgi:YggT family protein